MGYAATSEVDINAVSAFLLAERSKVLSYTEWRHRMRGYGFGLRRTDNGVEVSRLPKGQVLGLLHI